MTSRRSGLSRAISRPSPPRPRELLIEAGVPLYQRAGILVRPIIETVDASHGRTTQVAQLKILDSTYMRDLLCRHIEWQRYDGRKRDWVRTDPPLAIAATILARAGDWKFPAIAGVISTPTMRPDGSMLTEPGFDTATRLLLVAPPPMPPIPERPTRTMRWLLWRGSRSCFPSFHLSTTVRRRWRCRP